MPELRPVDLLIEGGYIMTMDASRRIIRDGAIAVDGDRFAHARVAPILTVEDEVWAACIVLIELLKTGGTTYLAAGSYSPGPVLEAIPRVGLRGFEGRRTFDRQPLYSEPYNLVCSASGDSADTVIVDGKIVMERREVKTIDEREVVARIKELSRGVEARSGVKPPTRWPIV